jgi:hypothetical protein
VDVLSTIVISGRVDETFYVDPEIEELTDQPDVLSVLVIRLMLVDFVIIKMTSQ